MRRRARELLCRSVVVALFCAGSVSAREITVRQDASGDFTSLEAAANSLSVGDTLSIGAGVWSEVYPWDAGTSGIVEVLLGVSVDSVTIIGDQAGGTVLESDQGQGTAITTSATVEFTRIENVRVKGVARGYVGLGSDAVELRNVRFDQCEIPAFITGLATFDNCTFARTTNVGVFGANSNAQVSLMRCDFVEGLGGLQMNPGSAGEVVNCDFDGVDSAVIADGASITVSDTQFRNLSLPLTARRGGNLDVRRVQAETASFGGIYCQSSSIVHVLDSSFIDVQSPVIDISSGGQVHMTSSQILPRDNGLFINASTLTTSPRIDLNFENNYWGTTDAEEIRARIVDGEDWPGNPAFNIFVDFEPFLLDPVKGAAQTMGSFKVRFLPREN